MIDSYPDINKRLAKGWKASFRYGQLSPSTDNLNVDKLNTLKQHNCGQEIYICLKLNGSQFDQSEQNFKDDIVTVIMRKTQKYNWHQTLLLNEKTYKDLKKCSKNQHAVKMEK